MISPRRDVEPRRALGRALWADRPARLQIKRRAETNFLRHIERWQFVCTVFPSFPYLGWRVCLDCAFVCAGEVESADSRRIASGGAEKNIIYRQPVQSPRM